MTSSTCKGNAAGDVPGARELMRRSREEHYAVGAFNVDNQETLIAIAREAQAKRGERNLRDDVCQPS